MNRFAFSETTLGYNIQSQAEEDSEFLHKTHVILDVTARRFFQPWIQPALLFRLSKHSKPFYRSVKYLNKFLSDVRLTHFHFGNENLKFNSIFVVVGVEKSRVYRIQEKIRRRGSKQQRHNG